MHSEIPPEIKLAIAQNFSRAANTYDAAAILQQEIGRRLIDRLDLIKINPTLILDLGGGTGFTTNLLSQKYPKAYILNLDIAEGMLTYAKRIAYFRHPLYLCADGEYSPLKNHSIDLVFSNCTFPWFFNPRKILSEIHRFLTPNGVLLFSTFGPDTLKELRQSSLFFHPENIGDPFPDMHDIGDILVQTEFLDPVLDKEIITLTYKTVIKLIRDIKLTGSYLKIPKSPQMIPPDAWNKFLQTYEAYRSKEGTLPATFEVIYGYALASKEEALLHRPDEEGTIHIPIDHLHRL